MKWEKFPFKIEKRFRLPGYDYSAEGCYFVTICTNDRVNLFRDVGTDPCVCSCPRNENRSFLENDIGLNSNIIHSNVKFNNHLCFGQKGIVGDINVIGKMIEKWWLKISQKFELIEIDKFIIMPNHLHGILVIKNDLNDNFLIKNVEERMSLRKEQTHGSVPTIGQNNGSVPTIGQNNGSVPTIGQNGGMVPTLNHNIFGNVDLLGKSIQWFKTMTTNEYIRNVKENDWPRFSKRLWQPRFHDRIIRNEKEYWTKRKYIENNPNNWGKDKNNLFVV